MSTRVLPATILALLMALAGSVALVAGPAVAGPVDAGWSSGGPGVTTASDGSGSAAAMTYDADGAGSASWTFTTNATAASAAGPITVPWTWQGLHAWFRVTISLAMIVDGQVVDTLVQEGPADCCTSPSNGFHYGGTTTFDVSPGQTYGFRLSGGNFDYNNFLRGTFTLSTKPYVDPTIGTDNRQWLGAANLPADGIAGPSPNRGGPVVPLPGGAGPAGQRGPEQSSSRLRRGPLRRHRIGLHPSARQLRGDPARGRIGRRGVGEPSRSQAVCGEVGLRTAGRNVGHAL